MKRHFFALLVLACAGCTPAVTKLNVADISKSDALQVTDKRPASEKENKIFSLLITSKEYGVIRTGDVHLSPPPVRLLQHEVYQKFGADGGAHTVTVYHFVIYQNMRTQLRAGAIGAGLGGALGSVVGNAIASHDAASQTHLTDEMSFNSISEEYLRGQYNASENPDNAAVYIIYVDTDIDGKKIFTRTVASMKPHSDQNPLAAAVELAIKNHLARYDAGGTVVTNATQPSAVSAATSATLVAATAQSGSDAQSTPANAGVLSMAQGVANQLGCNSVRPNGDTTFTASCGSYDVVIDCDGGKCHPVHTVNTHQ
jgi:hypothetical protein